MIGALMLKIIKNNQFYTKSFLTPSHTHRIQPEQIGPQTGILMSENSTTPHYSTTKQSTQQADDVTQREALSMECHANSPRYGKGGHGERGFTGWQKKITNIMGGSNMWRNLKEPAD